MTYEPEIAGLYWRAAGYIDRILGGEKRATF